MYFFYIDESGNLDTETSKQCADGSVQNQDPIYVLLAVGFHETKWTKFQTAITLKKRALYDQINQSRPQGTPRLDLADCEVKSSACRSPTLRAKHPFLSQLSDDELRNLTDCYYAQLKAQHMVMCAVVVDKRKLADYMDREKLHRKAWELLCERIEFYMRECRPKHNAILIADDINVQANRALALKHEYLLRSKTSAGSRLSHILEMPHFVRSELSEGIQLADLCAYNFYRAFKYADMEYEYFRKMIPYLYRSGNTHSDKIDGLKVFPDDSNLIALCARIRGEAGWVEVRRG